MTESDALREELDMLLYSISHDLRAPIRVILGFSEALAEDYAASLDQEGRDQLERIRAAATTLDQALESLVELSRVSQRELRIESVSISNLAAAIAATLKQEHAGREIEVVIEPDLHASADRSLIDTCFRHLLHNAFKFTSPRPHARIEIGRERQGGEDVLFIRDNGVGFNQQYAAKMFGAFQRLHPAADFKGAGMGLAIAQRIVHRHGGRVWATGAVDQGATIYLKV